MYLLRNLIQTVKEITPGQLDTFVSDVIADMATLKIFNVIAQSSKDIASQASSSRNAPGTAITPRPDQLPAVSRCAKKETPIITSKHLAAQRLLQDQQRAPQASTSHANSSGPQASTSASKNVDKGKHPVDRPAAGVEDKNKLKGATEEPAQRTGQVEQPNHEAHNAANNEATAAKKPDKNVFNKNQSSIRESKAFKEIAKQNEAHAESFKELGLKPISKGNIKHVVKHIQGPYQKGMSAFNESENVIKIGLEALKKGIKESDLVRVYDTGRIIGTNQYGDPTSLVKVVLNGTKDTIRTVYPV